jgi:hypothetical protein
MVIVYLVVKEDKKNDPTCIGSGTPSNCNNPDSGED